MKKIIETAIFAPCLDTGRVTMPRIINNLYSVPRIFLIKEQTDDD